MMLACSWRNERSFYIDEKTFVEGSYEEHGSQVNAGIARGIRRHIIGLATGGRLGVRVTDRLAIQTTRHTILRLMVSQSLRTPPLGHLPDTETFVLSSRHKISPIGTPGHCVYDDADPVMIRGNDNMGVKIPNLNRAVVIGDESEQARASGGPA